MQVVWLKRDLRLFDHSPLAEAAKQGPVLLLYVYEPDIYQSAEFDSSHLHFINQSLEELNDSLQTMGGSLTLAIGSMPDILDQIHRRKAVTALWSHQETGNRVTFDRDRRVMQWCRDQGIPWHERRQHGVIRRLTSRDGWSRSWEEMMAQPVIPRPKTISFASIPNDNSSDSLNRLHGIVQKIPTSAELGQEIGRKRDLQKGGESNAKSTLRSFLQQRSIGYRSEMSSPVTAFDSCSRLSPYLAWGCLSMRSVVNAVRDRKEELMSSGASAERSRWLSSLSSFRSRLHWHCHFIQKLEDEPAIEFENMSRQFDGMREDDFRSDYFQAWCEGQTGYPLVDACMRALHQGSWINFRMRAMLVSFASYHLWLHWRQTAIFLAKHFLDFEPGIHFSQFQMQSGTTGINAVRIYSPIKQVTDHDPHGVFIRQFVPELAHVPDVHLAQPHLMPTETQRSSGCLIGYDYPKPIVDHQTAYREAKSRVFQRRRQSASRAEAKRVYQKHGSRRRPRTKQPKADD
jgi:deoxyribodipyrimidine photo-lyase